MFNLQKFEAQRDQFLETQKQAEEKTTKIIQDHENKISNLREQLITLNHQIADLTLAGEPVTVLQKKSREIRIEIEELQEITAAIILKAENVDHSKLREELKKFGKNYTTEHYQERRRLDNEEQKLRDQAAELVKKADKIRSENQSLGDKTAERLLLPFAETIDPGMKNFSSLDQQKAIQLWLNGQDFTKDSRFKHYFPEEPPTRVTFIERPKEPIRIEKTKSGPIVGPDVNPPIVIRDKNGNNMGDVTCTDR